MSKIVVPAHYFKEKTTSKAVVPAGYSKKKSKTTGNNITFNVAELADFFKKKNKTGNITFNAAELADYFKNVSRKTSANYSFVNKDDDVGFLRQRPALRAIKPKEKKKTKKIKKEDIVLPTSYALNLNRRRRKRKNTVSASNAKRIRKEIDEYFKNN